MNKAWAITAGDAGLGSSHGVTKIAEVRNETELQRALKMVFVIIYSKEYHLEGYV